MHHTLNKLRHANRVRQENWPGSEAANELAFRCIEVAGEAGEVADAVKKLLRSDRGIAGNKGQSRDELLEAVKDEIGDVLISIDLLADLLGINLTDAFVDKFNKTSRKVGIPVVIDPGTLDTMVRPPF